MTFWAKLFGRGNRDPHEGRTNSGQEDLAARSIEKSIKLREISVVLGEATTSQGFLVSLGEEKTNAKEALFELVEPDPDLSRILGSHGASRKDLDDIYFKLIAAGAGQWADEHWVPASTLAFGATLDFVLRRRTDGDWMAVAFRMVEYFTNGEVGSVV
jgi:hypothetical protein